MSLKTVVLAGLASVASAHMIMTSPAAFLGHDGKEVNNSPLDPLGADFPCKMPEGKANYKKNPDYDYSDNTYKAGGVGKLAVMGTAVHGGGSCQISLSKDTAPNKSSVWKVIHSIEGGCPTKTAAGNLDGDNPNFTGGDTYEFPIPDELEAGEYTIAWTWFNKIGNREMYMNCGPAIIESEAGSKVKRADGFFNSLPDLFTANIGGQCTTADSTDLKFPNPGKSVSQGKSSPNLADPVGADCQAKGDRPSETPTDGGNDTPSTPEEPESPSPSSGSGAGDKPSAPGGVFITKAPKSDAPAATGTPETPSVPEVPSNGGDAPKAPEGPVTLPENPVEQPEEGSDSPAEEAPVEDAPAEDAPADGGAIPVGDGPSGGFTAGEACSNEGQWNCVNGSSFQRCASGAWSQVMALAAGIQCEGGQADTLNAKAIVSGKRSLRRVSRLRN